MHITMSTETIGVGTGSGGKPEFGFRTEGWGAIRNEAAPGEGSGGG